jgi:hypothetical protein
MHLAIPLCNEHKAQIDDRNLHEKQNRGKLSLSVVVSVVLGVLVMALIFFGFYGSDLIIIKILLSFLFGAPGGVLVFWPLYYLLRGLNRLIKKKKPYFSEDPYTPPYYISLQKDDNFVSARISISIQNDQICNEFKSLNKVEEHLVAAMNHEDSTVYANASSQARTIALLQIEKYSTVQVNAIKALVQARCETAVPAIIDKFIISLGHDSNICYAAEEAVICLGIPKPLDAKVVEQLIAGLKYGYARKAVITILSLSSIEHLLAALKNQDVGIRRAVIHGLGQTKNVDAVPALIDQLTDTKKDKGIRICDEAARALKAIGTPEALDIIEKWMAKSQE